MRKEKIYKSKTNSNITYKSTTIGSFKYLETFYAGKLLKPSGNPVNSIRECIAKMEAALPSMPWDGDMSKLSEVSDNMRSWIYSITFKTR